MRVDCDFLVVGGGVAGLTFALRAASAGDVLVITKRETRHTATAWAQGGIAAVLDPRDSFSAHVDDTLQTGGGLSHRKVVEVVVGGGPERIGELIQLGAKFSKVPESEALDLTQEGGHSARRIVHAGDMTGHELQRALTAAAMSHPRITIREHLMAIDLIDAAKYGGRKRILGCYALDERDGAVFTLAARETILATGGAGKVYVYTSNPNVATGDGVAMAYRAGATIANMEFFQFHPTCLFHPEARTFLISEALRGEGGVLRLADGTAFMTHHHPMKDLAPRDVVARAIDYEMKRSGDDCVYLDMSSKPPAYLEERFPNIHRTCLRYGIDMRKVPIPVVPAAHYLCGGVLTDGSGRTTVPGLWAVGEVSCSGLHGANRLASNSLLEGLVLGHEAANAVLREPGSAPGAIVDWDPGSAVPSDEEVIVSHNWEELRRFMWNYVGIVRSTKRLRRAAARVALLQEEIREYYWNHLVSRDLLELRNIADVAELIIQSALARKESRGLHYTLDHPEQDDAHFRNDTLIAVGKEPWRSQSPPI